MVFLFQDPPNNNNNHPSLSQPAPPCLPPPQQPPSQPTLGTLQTLFAIWFRPGTGARARLSTVCAVKKQKGHLLRRAAPVNKHCKQRLIHTTGGRKEPRMAATPTATPTTTPTAPTPPSAVKATRRRPRTLWETFCCCLPMRSRRRFNRFDDEPSELFRQRMEAAQVHPPSRPACGRACDLSGWTAAPPLTESALSFALCTVRYQLQYRAQKHDGYLRSIDGDTAEHTWPAIGLRRR